jgi:hypothetical protein
MLRAICASLPLHALCSSLRGLGTSKRSEDGLDASKRSEDGLPFAASNFLFSHSLSSILEKKPSSR